jgi:hypothetical protein
VDVTDPNANRIARADVEKRAFRFRPETYPF